MVDVSGKALFVMLFYGGVSVVFYAAVDFLLTTKHCIVPLVTLESRGNATSFPKLFYGFFQKF